MCFFVFLSWVCLLRLHTEYLQNICFRARSKKNCCLFSWSEKTNWNYRISFTRNWCINRDSQYTNTLRPKKFPFIDAFESQHHNESIRISLWLLKLLIFVCSIILFLFLLRFTNVFQSCLTLSKNRRILSDGCCLTRWQPLPPTSEKRAKKKTTQVSREQTREKTINRLLKERRSNREREKREIKTYNLFYLMSTTIFSII